MHAPSPAPRCPICDCQVAATKKVNKETNGLCPGCLAVERAVRERPETVKKLWLQHQREPILPELPLQNLDSEVELPEVLDGKRYRTIDRDRNKWYLSVSEVNGMPVEVFASTAFDRDHELQARIANLTTITRLISMLLRHIFLGERLTFDKCLKQIQRSSRQKNDLPDMLYGVLSRYRDDEEETVGSPAAPSDEAEETGI